MTTETTFFDSDDIAVTNARFVVGAQTFAMRGITSVKGVEFPRSYTGPAVLILPGVVAAIASATTGGLVAALFGALAVLLLAGGIWWAFWRKPTYAVVLRTAGGEVTAYQSADRAHRIAAFIAAVTLVVLALLLASEGCFAGRSLRRKAALIQVGDARERVRSLLGRPAESGHRSLGDGSHAPKQEWWAYGSIVDSFKWQWPPATEFPWIAQCNIHLFGPDPKEVVVYFDSAGRVIRVRIPAR
jgi:hypothetical protein